MLIAPVRAPLARDAGPLAMSDIFSPWTTGRRVHVEFAFLFADWLGKPVWMWLGFISIVIALLVFDLGVLHRDAHEI